MFSRKEGQFLLDLPTEWSLSVSELLNTNYQNQISSLDKTFQVYGKLYHGELVIIATLVNEKRETDIPTSYFVSMDLADGQDYSKYLSTLVDSIGEFFETYFATPDWMDYIDLWTDETYKDVKLFYKINRENIALSIRAEQLLGQ